MLGKKSLYTYLYVLTYPPYHHKLVHIVKQRAPEKDEAYTNFGLGCHKIKCFIRKLFLRRGRFTRLRLCSEQCVHPGSNPASLVRSPLTEEGIVRTQCNYRVGEWRVGELSLNDVAVCNMSTRAASQIRGTLLLMRPSLLKQSQRVLQSVWVCSLRQTLELVAVAIILDSSQNFK